jgi:hypothetical protein
MGKSNMKITKELIDELNDPDISKRKYDSIIPLIEERALYIWRQLMKISHRTLSWYAFDNDVELGRGEGSTGGYFDPKRYNKSIGIAGNYDRKYNEYYKYDDEFPTRFLWMEDDDWEKEVLTNISESVSKIKLDKEISKQKRDEKKQKQVEMTKIIKSKLSKEELKYIRFK